MKVPGSEASVWWVLMGTLGLGAGIALGAAAVAAGGVAWEQGYWSAGFYRLIVDGVWREFDRGVPLAAAIAFGVAAVGQFTRRWGASMGRWNPWRVSVITRAGLAVLVIVTSLRGFSIIDSWYASHGPNVMLISIDTLRADRLGAYGYGLPTSPTIDRLAEEGVTFEHCFSQSPKTTPSHMTMLTSLYPCVHGVSMWEGSEPGPVLSPAVHTLAEVLKNAGYATGAFTGRGHVHKSRGFGQGFDVYVHNAPYQRRYRYEHFRQLDRATHWMRENRDRKFFVFFHTYAVHDPYVPPEDLVKLFDEDNYRGPVREAVGRLWDRTAEWQDAHRLFWASVNESDPRDVRFVRRLYDAVIRRMDEATVSTLLGHLAELGLAGETLIVLTSDHGEAFGEHGRFLHGDLYAETLRVPLILRFPGRLPAGKRVRSASRVIDIMPTILDLLDLPAPPGGQGRSLAPLIGGDELGHYPLNVVSEFSSLAQDRVFESLRRGKFTYIVDRSVEQLFNHAKDPEERRNVAAERRAELESMRDELARWHHECRRLGAVFGPRGEMIAPSEETVRQLRALGYVK